MSTKIIQFQGAKVKRLEAVDISFKENGVTVIGGGNAQGKTSVLDMIMSAVKGAKYNPSDPIKDGSERGEVKITLNNGVVIRRTFKGNRSTLKVEGCSGSEQNFLNELFGEHALDVRKFMLSSKKTQTLMEICGLDFSQIDEEHDRLYAERTIANRYADSTKKAYESLPYYEGAPEQEVMTSKLVNRLNDLLAEQGNRRNELRDAKEINVRLNEEHSKLCKLRDELKQQLKKLDEETIPNASRDLDESAEAVAILEDDFTKSSYDDRINEFNAQIANADETNAKARANREKRAARERAEEALCVATRLNEEIKENRDIKKQMLEDANFPLPALTIEDGEMRYRGRAWDGLSTAEQFAVATSIQAALKPDAPIVLLDHMEAFDEASLANFSDWCERRGYQVIGTRVSTGNECDVIIEDGSVKDD